MYLFASDILGDSDFLPRHAKAYADFRKWRADMQQDRIRAFTEFRKDCHSGDFPNENHSTKMKEGELEKVQKELKFYKVYVLEDCGRV